MVEKLRIVEDVPSTVYCSQTNGNDTTGDGSYYNPFATIQKAVDEIGDNEHRVIIVDDNENCSPQYVTLPDTSVYRSCSIFAHSGILVWYGGITTLTVGNNWSVTLNNIYVGDLVESVGCTWAEVFMEEGQLASTINVPNITLLILGTFLTNTPTANTLGGYAWNTLTQETVFFTPINGVDIDNHVSRHEYGGDDEIDPANIGEYGVAELDAGGQVTADPKAHATSHEKGGADEIDIEDLMYDSGNTKNWLTLLQDGSGGVVFSAPIKHISQASEPTLDANQLALWTDTDDENRNWLVYNDGSIQMKVELGAHAKDHASSHESAGGDAITIVESQISDLDHTDTDAIHDNVAGEISALAEKASPVDADLVLIEDSEDGNNKKKVQLSNISGGGGTFGSEFAETSVDAEDTNTTTTQEDRIDYTTASLTAGQKYRVSYYFEGKVANPGEKADFTFIVDGTTRGACEVKDDYYVAQSGFYYYTPGSTGTKSIKIGYNVGSGTTGTAYIRNARVEIWRVA